MCLELAALPTAHPAHGFLRAAGMVVGFAGLDSDVATQTVPNRLPAQGRAHVVKRDGRWVLRRFVTGNDIRLDETTIVGTIIHVGADSNDLPISLFKAEAVLEPSHGAPWDDKLLGRLRVTKATLDPLRPADFDRIVAKLSGMMARNAGHIGKEAMESFASTLRIDWANGTERKLSAAAKRLNGAMRAAQAKTWTAVKGTVQASGLKTAKQTAASTVASFNFDVAGSLKVKDIEALQRSISASAHFMRDFHMNRLAPALSVQMRGIVTSGLYHGLSPDDMARNLRKGLGSTAAKYSQSYLNVVASAVSGRARSFSQLTSYAGAGIQTYEVSAIIDQVTTPFCRMIDGTILSVDRGLQGFAATDALSDPMGVQFTQPWVSERTIQGGADEGKKGLFIRGENGSKLAGVIERSGYGKENDKGTFSKQMSPKQLESANIGPPPYHSRCRTTTLPGLEQSAASPGARGRGGAAGLPPRAPGARATGAGARAAAQPGRAAASRARSLGLDQEEMFSALAGERPAAEAVRAKPKPRRRKPKKPKKR